MRRVILPLAASLLSGLAQPAVADDHQTSTLALTVNETAEVWGNIDGGVQTGATQLNKVQLLVDFDGDRAGLPGWTARLQYFRTNNHSLSGQRVGDIQTVSNIEALGADRLMEAWVERRLGKRAAIRAGLMDLNADFDSVEPAALFINSSHGIGPDLSRSGLNGPSIFPVSSLGAHASWAATDFLTLKAAAFDGVPGDPADPKAFAAVNLSRRDGALLIGQADWDIGKSSQASLGVWGYTAEFDRLDAPGERQDGQAGVYGFVSGSLPATGWSGWVRAGVADPKVAVVTSYLGAGVVGAGVVPGRPDDQVGFALARAGLGAPARRAADLPLAETALEATYSIRLRNNLSVQPDVQYIIHPASGSAIPNALVVGVRLAISITRP